MGRFRTVLLALALFAVLAVAQKGTKRSDWRDTELTTNLWNVISSGNSEELASMLSTSKDQIVASRAADGRGPLWWAYEYGKEDMVQMLLAAGVSPDEQDADGKKPEDVRSVGPTDYAKQQQAAWEQEAATEEPVAPPTFDMPDEDD